MAVPLPLAKLLAAVMLIPVNVPELLVLPLKIVLLPETFIPMTDPALMVNDEATDPIKEFVPIIKYPLALFQNKVEFVWL